MPSKERTVESICRPLPLDWLLPRRKFLHEWPCDGCMLPKSLPSRIRRPSSVVRRSFSSFDTVRRLISSCHAPLAFASSPPSTSLSSALADCQTMADMAAALDALGCVDESCHSPASVGSANTFDHAAALQANAQYTGSLTADILYATAETSNDSTLDTLNDFLDFMGVEAHGSQRGSSTDSSTIYALESRPLLRRDTFLLPSASSATGQAQVSVATRCNSRTDSASCHDQTGLLPQDRIPRLSYHCSTPRHDFPTGTGRSNRRARRRLLHSGCTPSPGKAPQTIEVQQPTLTRADSSHFPAPDFARSSSYAVSTGSPSRSFAHGTTPNRERRSVAPSPPRLPTGSFTLPHYGSQVTGQYRTECNAASYTFLPSDGSSMIGQHVSSDSNEYYATAASILGRNDSSNSPGHTPRGWNGEQVRTR
jgi:hypothetical protein